MSWEDYLYDNSFDTGDMGSVLGTTPAPAYNTDGLLSAYLQQMDGGQQADLPGYLSMLSSEGSPYSGYFNPIAASAGQVIGNSPAGGKYGYDTSNSVLAQVAAGNDPSAAQPQEKSFMARIAQGLGLTDKNGKTDISDPKTLDAWMRTALGGANILNALLGRNTAKGYVTPAQAKSALAPAANSWTPAQQQSADAYFGGPAVDPLTRTRIAASQLPSAIVASRGYARGGNVQDAPYRDLPPRGALSAYVEGDTPGQDDTVDAKLSHGEYVFDADAVSALGDGNNAAGARRLDAMREKLREHKRSAPPDKIPPKAHAPEHYLPKKVK